MNPIRFLATLIIDALSKLVFDTPSEYGKYRVHTMPHHTDEDDRIFFMASYNENWDPDTGAITKDVAGKAAFHYSTESDWLGHIEMNFDYTLDNDVQPRRIMGMMIDTATGLGHWAFTPDPATSQSFRIGYTEPTVAEWRGTSSTAAVRFLVRNDSPAGDSLYMVQNSNGATGHVQVGASAGGTLFGLPKSGLFCVYGDTPTVMGTAGAHPFYFATGTTVRGLIAADGTWYQRRSGVDYRIPYDAVAGSAVTPLRAGEYYASAYGTSIDTTTALAVDTMRAAPFFLSRKVTVDRIGIQVVTGAASSFVHLGIYEDDGTGRPGDRALATAALDSSSAGSKEATVSVQLEPGLYWLVAGAKGGSPVVQMLTGGNAGMVPQAYAASSVPLGYLGSFTGAQLPDPFAYTSTVAEIPRVLVRVQ